MFGLLLNSAYTVSRLCFSHSASLANRLGVDNKLRGDTAGTTDPIWPKGYSVSLNVCCNRNQGRGRKGLGGIGFKMAMLMGGDE